MILEDKVRKLLIFNDSHNVKTGICREKLYFSDLEVISTWNKLTDGVIFIPGVSLNFISCGEVEVTCVHPTLLLPKAASSMLIVFRILDIATSNMITF